MNVNYIELKSVVQQLNEHLKEKIKFIGVKRDVLFQDFLERIEELMDDDYEKLSQNIQDKYNEYVEIEKKDVEKEEDIKEEKPKKEIIKEEKPKKPNRFRIICDLIKEQKEKGIDFKVLVDQANKRYIDGGGTDNISVSKRATYLVISILKANGEKLK